MPPKKKDPEQKRKPVHRQEWIIPGDGGYDLIIRRSSEHKDKLVIKLGADLDDGATGDKTGAIVSERDLCDVVSDIDENVQDSCR